MGQKLAEGEAGALCEAADILLTVRGRIQAFGSPTLRYLFDSTLVQLGREIAVDLPHPDMVDQSHNDAAGIGSGG